VDGSQNSTKGRGDLGGRSDSLIIFSCALAILLANARLHVILDKGQSSLQPVQIRSENEYLQREGSL
jgi:hypothetical protein